jgi:hypothetical protein
MLIWAWRAERFLYNRLIPDVQELENSQRQEKKDFGKR